MKKLALLFMVALTAITLAGCSEKQLDLDNLDVLRVGMDLRWPPFETVDENQNPAGISVDMAKELGQYLGVEIEIVDTNFSSLIVALETKQIDIIIASMSITEERAQKINFTDPYFYFPLITLIDNDLQFEGRNIETKEELFGLDGVHFVGQSSFVSLSIPAAQATNPVLLEFTDTASAVAELTNGQGEAFIISPVAAVSNHLNNPDTTYLMWDPVSVSPIGMGVRKIDTDLLDKVNEFIDGLVTNGVYARLGEAHNATISASLPEKDIWYYVNQDE